jgi:hypothetical protein
MTNKDMVPRPGNGPEPKDRNPPQGPKKVDGAPSEKERASALLDPPDSPQVKPSQDRR